MKLYAFNIEPLYDESLFSKYLNCASKQRRDKVERFRYQKDKNLSLGAGILIDVGLKEYGLQEKDMVYLTNEQGKPYISKYAHIHFNVSHSGNLVVGVFSECEVGCDVEKINDADFEIAKRYFNPKEYEFISSQPNIEKQRDTFFRLWTLKESFMKIVGMGMSLSLDSFCININSAGIKVSQSVDKQDYYFREFFVDENYKVAFCSTEEFNNCDVEWIKL